MGYTIVIAGKGGIGKSTIAALLIRVLKDRRAGSVLGVDADPNANLAEFLGVTPAQTVGEILDAINTRKDKIPAGMTKDRFIEYEVGTIIEECDGFDILTMGRPEGPGCYCYVNNVLRGVLGKLIKHYDYVVIDNEAGLEHLSRKTTSACDALLVVSDATPAGLRAARRIAELTDELKIKAKKKFLLVNRASADAARQKLDGLDLEYLGAVPQDACIEKFSMKGASLLELEKDSSAYSRVAKVVEKII